MTSSLAEKRLVCKEILVHLLKHHFNIDNEEIHYTAAEMDSAFAVNECFKDFLQGDNNAENMAIQVIKSFDELGKNLRALDELPLVITSVLGKTFFVHFLLRKFIVFGGQHLTISYKTLSILGKSPVFRYCELLPVISNARLFSKENKDTFNASIINEAVIQFGTCHFNLYFLLSL